VIEGLAEEEEEEEGSGLEEEGLGIEEEEEEVSSRKFIRVWRSSSYESSTMLRECCAQARFRAPVLRLQGDTMSSPTRTLRESSLHFLKSSIRCKRKTFVPEVGLKVFSLMNFLRLASEALLDGYIFSFCLSCEVHVLW